MDQSELREWENRCIQEEAPWCQAACPLRVDVRGFMARMAANDPTGARKILEKTMPLPGVMGRICDHPCEASCKRGEAGDPLAIGLLEQAAMRLGRPGPKPLVLPATGKVAAVVGAGLAALTCAWDLARKGHAVTILAPGEQLGGSLRDLPESVLPCAELERELGQLAAMDVNVHTGRTLDLAFLAATRAEFGAVFVEAGIAPGLCPEDRSQVDPLTLARRSEDAPSGVFYGGWTLPEGPSFVQEAADGRRAAASMDRYLNKASLTAAREREGAGPTRLFTSLADVRPLPRVIPADQAHGFDAAEAAAESARCLDCQCMQCVKVCAYLDRYKGYPRKYARQIYNNAAIVQGVHQANLMVNSCSLCGLCTEVCPERFSMADLCLTARRDMVARGKMPPSAHEFALEDMAFSNGPDFALARTDPGRAECAHLFFPGCQLAASHPHHVRAVYEHLRGGLSGGVGLMLRCCAIPARWAGRDDLFEAALGELLMAWKGLGKPQVITACSSCLAVFREAAPQLAPTSLWGVLPDIGLPEEAGARPEGPLALHDPCTMRHDAEAQAAVRDILRQRGVRFEELRLSGLYTECCGYGGLMGNAAPDMARQVAARRTAASPLDFAASCAMCRDRLAAEGKRTWHVLDFLFPGPAAAPDFDPAARGPGWSDRHETRARLKQDLLREIWGESSEPSEELPELLISPELAQIMEERRILREDLRALIQNAESDGQWFTERGGLVLAGFRPRRVTFWAEYERKDGAFVLHRAWSHRMQPSGAGSAADSGDARSGAAQVYLPESGEWSCSCGEPLDPRLVEVSYLGSAFTITLLACARCGRALIPESLALGKMAEVERLLEDK